MEAHEEGMAYSNSNSSAGESPCPFVIKRKRTKRHRQPPSAASSASSTELSGTTQEEEDMANCLILLAQGPGTAERFTSRKFNEAVTTAGGRVGFYVYECKTCSKCFPSFQALGGHRASHKKLKAGDTELLQISMSSFSKPMDLPGSGGKQRTHECSICGSEFASGQALGGHMRRHRAAVVLKNSSDLKKKKCVFSLDLNLPPAPIDDDRFAVGPKPLGFSPSASVALLDCHY